MLLKDLNVLMFKQCIGKNTSVFLDVFAKVMFNYNNQNKLEFILKLYSNTMRQQSISYCGPHFEIKFQTNKK